ncbi:hypothetical protein [Mycolicibacterium sp. PDY-3]|uniref:hypothetical protein n=1 Tax=Mycolicibacterium sp. PDY-3 TaxID=3376069 RepID=UPI00378B4EAE
MAVLWVVGSFAYTQFDIEQVKARPSTEYINYTSLTTGNIREGEDLFYTVCREFKGRYEVTGKRTIYVIPQGKSARDRVFETALPYKGTVEGKPCQSYKIAASAYHLSPGRYQLSLSGTFKVDYGIEKNYYIDGDVLTVYPQPAGAVDVKAQLFNLSPDEIEELKRILGISSGSEEPITIVPEAPLAQTPTQDSPDPVASRSPSPNR